MKARNNQELAHLWASQNVESAEGSNFSFHGTLLYSYRTVIGRFINDINGKRIVLLSSYGYSNTTRKHLSFAARAVSHVPVFVTKELAAITKIDAFPQIIKGAKELIADELKTLPEKFKPNTAKANGVYGAINHQIQLIERLSHEKYEPITEVNASAWRKSWLHGVKVEYVSKNMDDLLSQLKSFNKVVNSGEYYNSPDIVKDCLDDLIELKNQATELGLKVPTGTATAIKQANKNLPICIERKYAANLMQEVSLLREQVGRLFAFTKDAQEWTLMRSRSQIESQKLKIESLLKKKPPFVLPTPIVEPLGSAFDYIPQEDRDKLVLFDKRREEVKQNLLTKWKAGEYAIDLLEEYQEIYLRVKGDAIETSHCAVVPLSVAKKVWRLVKMVMRSGKGLAGDFGESARIGHYTLDKINPDGSIVVGCHNISYDELKYVADKLGFN